MFYDKLLEKTVGLLAQRVIALYEARLHPNRQLPLPPCKEVAEGEASITPLPITQAGQDDRDENENASDAADYNEQSVGDL